MAHISQQLRVLLRHMIRLEHLVVVGKNPLRKVHSTYRQLGQIPKSMRWPHAAMYLLGWQYLPEGRTEEEGPTDWYKDPGGKWFTRNLSLYTWIFYGLYPRTTMAAYYDLDRFRTIPNPEPIHPWEDNVRQPPQTSAPYSVILIQDCIHALADVIDEVEDAYKPLEDATICHSQKHPYEPQSELYTHFNKLTQLTNRAQLRAAKAMVNLKVLLDWTESQDPTATRGSTQPLNNRQLSGDYRHRKFYSIETGGSRFLAYEQTPTNNISLPQFIRKGTRRILVRENTEDVETKYLLIPPPASPSSEFQVRSERITSELDVSSPLEAEEAPWYVKMGGQSLGEDELGVDDDGNSRSITMPIINLPRVPGTLSWQKWVFRTYHNAFFHTAPDFVRALYHLHSQHGYFDHEDPYYPLSAALGVDFTVLPYFRDDHKPTTPFPPRWCKCMKDWTNNQVAEYDAWKPKPAWFPGDGPFEPIELLRTPISNLQPRPVSTRRRPVLVSSSGLATSPIRSRPTSTAPTSPASSIIVAPPTEVPTDTEDYDDVASSNMAEEPVGDF